MEFPSDIAASHQEIVNLHALLQAREREFDQKASAQSYEILRLKEKNAELLRKLYGRSSEKRILATSSGVVQGVLSLGEGVEAPARAVEPAAPKTATPKAPSKKVRLEGSIDEQGRFPDDLERRETVIDEGETAGAVMSTKVTERLCVEPSQFYVEVIKRVVRKQSDGSIVQPLTPEAVLPRRCVDASFLAYISIMKFQWHLPLYRQEQMLKSQGIRISRDTLIRYVIEVAQLLGRLYDTLLGSVFEAGNVFADETPVLVGKGTKGNRKYTESRFWPFLGNNSIVFVYAKTRAAKEIEPLLEAYEGYLQVDGYRVYETVANKFPDITLVFCWAHARRKFIEAEQYYPEDSKEALRYIRALYRIEEAGRASPEKIPRLRRRFSKKVLDLFKKWLDAKLQEPKTLPKSTLGGAISYALTRWEGLCRYTEDPILSIDSNPIERQIRPVALGRKNWLFCASEIGAEAACVMYSLIASCKLAGIEPHEYLTDVLSRINDHSQLTLHELLPQNWKPLPKKEEVRKPD
jgi:transposase